MTKPATEITYSAKLPPEQLARLLEISARLSSTLHLDELLALVMDVSTDLTNTEAASILLLDESSGQLQFVASTDGLMPADIQVPLDNSIAGWVVQHGQQLIIEDVQTDERFFATVDQSTQFQTQTMLAVPLRTAEKVIGALEVINKQDGASYTPQDVALMDVLASQAAVAIVNARLFEQFDLLAEIMHELKTPMMAIYSAAELLSRPEFPDEKKGLVVQMIKRESKRLSKMTKDYLDLARLESRRARMERQPVDLVVLVADVVEVARAQATARQIRIVTELAPDVPPAGELVLWGDTDRLKQALLNLLSNAIKYNRENGRITISAHREQDCLHLAVTDTGFGIGSEDIEQLFDPFYRIPGSEQAAEGSGLGLAIAHKIIEQHQGQILVSSVPNEGTTFAIQLPLSAKANEPLAAT
jgi:signal transduction histidine kinase